MKNRAVKIMSGVLCAAMLFSGCGILNRNKDAKSEMDDLPEGIEIEAASAASATPEATATPAPVSISGYQGVYLEELTQAGTLSMKMASEDTMDINVEWKASGGDVYKWKMTGVYDSSGNLFRYSDAVKTKLAAGNTGETTVSTPQTGSFTVSGMRMIWAEGCDLMTSGSNGSAGNFMHPEFVYSMTLDEYATAKATATPTPTAVPPTATPTPEATQAPVEDAAAAESASQAESTEAADEGEQASEEEQTNEGLYYVTADELNVRSAPSTDAEVIDAIPQGHDVRVLEHVDDENVPGGWYKIEYEGVDEAYVSAEFLSKY